MRLLRSFNVNQIPLWMLISGALSVAVLLPFLAIIGLSVTQADRINSDVIDTYLQDIASAHVQDVEGLLQRTSNSISSVALNRQYRIQVISLLRGEDSSFLRPTVINLLNNRLIESGEFSFISLIDRSGRIIADTRAGRVGANESNSAAFQAGVNAQLLGDDQRIIIYEAQNRARIEIVQLVTDVGGSVEGYMVGGLNLDSQAAQMFNIHPNFLPVFVYIVTRDGVLFVDEDLRDEARTVLNAGLLQTATAGQASNITLEIDDQIYKAYYTPALNGRLAVIAQTVEIRNLVPSLLDVIVNNIYLVALLVAGVGGLSFLLTRRLSVILRGIREAVTGVHERQYNIPVPAAARNDEIGTLAHEFVRVRSYVEQYVEDQERRTEALVRDIQATQEVARYASTQRDIQALMDDTVNLITSQFPNIYHAQIFLLDSDSRWAVLQASTGQPGRQLLARGHRLGVGSISVIGQVTAQNTVVVARDTATSDVHKRNEFLPDTRSELAIPLRVGGQVIGALDVQSKESDTFTQDQVNILRTMADQIAISIDNARLYQESVQRLQELNASNRRQTEFDWLDYLADERSAALTLRTGIKTEDDSREELRQRAIETSTTQVGSVTDRSTVPIAVPIRIREGTIGAVVWEFPLSDVSADKVQLAEELVTRLAVSLDNARLFQTSKKAADRERIVNEIASKLTGKTDVSEILQTAVREVGQALRAPEVNIHLRPQRPSSNGHHDETV